MIPQQYAYAGCGSCHTHIRVPSQKLLVRGQSLVERYDCLACHRIDGRGGTLRPGGAGGMEGPDLSHVGLASHRADWYEHHLAEIQKAANGPWKASFGPIDEDDRQAIEVFLASRVGAPRLLEAKALFHTLGCRGCHKIGGVGGDDGPDLTLAGEKDPGRLDFTHVPGEPTVANWLAEHFRDPAKIVPDSKMPDLHLTEEQVDLLTFYMMSLRRSDVPEAYWPKDRIQAERFGEREFSIDGETLYGTFCAACHGLSGEGRRYPDSTPFPAVGHPDFLAVASDEFLVESIRRGRPGRRMPAWGEKEGGLRPEEIDAVVGYLRRLGGGPDALPAMPKERRWVKADVRRGTELFTQFCAGCHGANGEGKQAPALNNKTFLAIAGDTYLVEMIGRGRRGTDMPGFRNPSPTNPVLSNPEIESIVAFIRTWEDASP
jgi:cbb3-type cytochrome c oxidase subunit III